jgi:hypothetical protein
MARQEPCQQEINGAVEEVLADSVAERPPSGCGPRPQVGWSTRKVGMQRDEKEAMARYFVQHDFLVADSITGARLKFATILVNPGTTQQFVIKEALEWMKSNDEKFGPFDITWYTPGSLMPATLKEFRDQNPELIQATQLFLFPGRLDIQIDSVASPETAAFVENYDRAFTYALLSANSFDIKKGRAYFHFSSEIALQQAMALKEAHHKFLFLDSSKLDTIREGGIGYDLQDLLNTYHTVNIYTVSSSKGKDAWIKARFTQLSSHLLKVEPQSDNYEPDAKMLRLQIVGLHDTPSERSHFSGSLLNPRTK